MRVDRLGHLPAALRPTCPSRAPPGGFHRLRVRRLLRVHIRDESAQHQPPSRIRRVSTDRGRRRDILSGDEQHSESRRAREGSARRHELVPRAVESHRVYRVDDAPQQLFPSRQPPHLCRVYGSDGHRIARCVEVHLHREGRSRTRAGTYTGDDRGGATATCANGLISYALWQVPCQIIRLTFSML